MTGKISKLKVLGLIPARGGSKGVKGKNIASLGGKPLIQYTIEAVNESECLSDCIVSTDSDSIADVARSLGASVPFMRPSELAGDRSRAQDAALHAIEQYDPEGNFDYVLLLQPTAPFRTGEDIDKAIRMAEDHAVTSLVSFAEAETHHPYYMYYVDSAVGDIVRVKPACQYEVGTPRQEFPRAVYRNGAIYLTRIDYLKASYSFVSEDVVAYIMPPERSVNIDTQEDLAYAEFLLAKKASQV